MSKQITELHRRLDVSSEAGEKALAERDNLRAAHAALIDDQADSLRLPTGADGAAVINAVDSLLKFKAEAEGVLRRWVACHSWMGDGRDEEEAECLLAARALLSGGNGGGDV